MNLPALTIHQPWAWAIACGSKPVENRGWVTYFRGDFAVHAGMSVGTRWDFELNVQSVARRCGVPEQVVIEAAEVRGAVIAVATLVDVCSASRHIGFASTPRCDCGPWAGNQQRHFKLADVRALPEPIPVKGAQQFWSLPDDVDARVRAALPEVTK